MHAKAWTLLANTILREKSIHALHTSLLILTVHANRSRRALYAYSIFQEVPISAFYAGFSVIAGLTALRAW